MSTMAFDTIILGAGITGRACARHLAGRERILLMDTRDPPPSADAVAAEFPGLPVAWGEPDVDLLCGAGRIVVSPGLPLDLPALNAARAAGVHLLGELDLFAESVNAPVLAITGTNGKSTVTSLLGHVLGQLGQRVAVGGNLGTPAVALLADDVDVYVLELSSFQLELAGTFRANAAAVLNVSEDHLDRYADIDEYAEVKRRVFRDVRAAVCNRDDALTWPDDDTPRVTFGTDAPGGNDYGLHRTSDGVFLARGREQLLDVAELTLRGLHNHVNVLAALALAELAGADPVRAVRAACTFSGLAHRCQLVAEIDGVEAIDDSKATNPGACVAALDGLDPDGARRIVLIAGGRGKGFDLEPLREPVGRHVRAAVLIGEQAEPLRRVLGGVTDISCAPDMQSAVRRAFEHARPGDCVLLSPACASFDQFDNFEARGEAFATAVRALGT